MSKERGMIFNGDMVRAILDGRKTQTRRPVNSSTCDLLDLQKTYPHKKYNIGCPFGKIGDHIWVRETWATLGNEDGCSVDWNDNLCKGDEKSAARIYRASCEQRAGDYGLWSIPDDDDWKPHTENQKFEGAWRPSSHMPHWASRILLEITDVRVERLNSISEIDANQEGMRFTDYGVGRFGQQRPGYSWKPTTHTDQCLPNARMAFANLWESIYGDYTWRENPWVWVIEFSRVKGTAA